MTLDGQVAVITGAGRGIGRAIALTFAQDGARIAVTGRTRESRERVSAEIVAAGGEARPFELDVTQDNEAVQAVADVLSVWGRIDILVNNAGIIHPKTPVWQATISDWDEEMSINLRGTFLCCHYVLPQMVERGEGVVINIGSSSGTQPEDIARAALFLAAHAPAGMTGQFINLFGANDHSGHAPGPV